MGTLSNIGNSCYMNTVLYALRFTPTFLTNFHHLIANILMLYQEIEVKSLGECKKCEASQHVKRSYKILATPSQGTIDVLIKLHEVFVNLSSGGRSGAVRQASALQKSIHLVNDTFVPLTQQDSHEFLMFILNCIGDFSEFLTNLVPTHPGIFEGIDNPESTLCFNYFRTNFIGHRLSVRRCLCCETVVNHYDEFIDLFVALPTGFKLDGSFIRNSCLTKERISDKTICSVCNRLCQSVQRNMFPELPRILIVQICRFENQMTKIHTPAPTLYQLDCFCMACEALPPDAKNDNHQYRLYGLIVHVGRSPTSGHGCAYGDCCKMNLKRTTTNRIDQNWYICNDDIITNVSQTDFDLKVANEAKRKTPYILLYARNDLAY